MVLPLSVEEIDQVMAGGPADQMPREPTQAAPVPRGGIVDVAALLQLDPETFVRASYREVLGRRPDPDGLRHHLTMLAGGLDKQSMLLALRQSPEGVLYNCTLVGSRRQSRLDRLFAMPVVGGILRRIVLRLPSYRLREAVMTLEDTAQRQQHEIERLLAEQASMAVTQNRMHDQRRQAEAAIRGEIERALDGLAREPWLEPMLQLADRHERTRAELNRLTGTPAEIARVDQAVRLQAGRIDDAERLAARAARDMRDQARRLNLILETIRQRSGPLDEDQVAALQGVQDHLLDSLYVEFEARFRGSPALIKARQQVHLPVMLQADAGLPARPIIDVGAGRGEWLELLREAGLTASGIDLNGTMVASCVEAGLDCVQGDAVAGLAKVGSNSLGAVTGFHIIEHLPFRVMVALLDEALRVLAPGGVILFETPNPANLQVGSRWFYLDPSHRNPLPAEMVAMIAEARGFVRVRIQYLHPMPEKFETADKLLGEQLDALLHGPMDYALIAYKA